MRPFFESKLNRQIGALTLAAICLGSNAVTVVAFPKSQRCSDFLLAGVALGLALSAQDRRWSSLGMFLSGAMLVIGAFDLRGWAVAAMWGCALGLWFLRGARQERGATSPP